MEMHATYLVIFFVALFFVLTSHVSEYLQDREMLLLLERAATGVLLYRTLSGWVESPRKCG